MEQNKEYFVFISYSSLDNEWAIWLRHELEHYHLPASFNGRTDVRDNLRKVFRDRDELSAGPEWDEQVQKALEDTNNLIVICSPHSAKSDAVNKEIEAFIALGKEDHIFPFIVEGEKPEDCFPPALRHSKLGGDVNKDGGRDSAFIKVVAGMLKVSFPSLWNRYEIEKAEEERKIREQRDKLLIMQSRFLAEKANALVDEGDSYTAMRLALFALPNNTIKPDRPYVKEVEDAFRKAYLHNDAILRGHPRDIVSISLSDENHIVSVSNDSPSTATFRLWNLENGECILSKGDIGSTGLCNVLLSPNEGLLASNPTANTLYISSVGPDLKILSSFLFEEWIKSIAFSPDSNYLSVAFDSGIIKVIEISSEKEILNIKGHSNSIDSVSYSQDGRFIISSADSFIQVWDSSTGQMIKEINDCNIKFCNATVSLNGKYIVSDAFFEGEVYTWDWDSLELIHHYNGRRSQFSPSSRFLATVKKNKIYVWNVVTGKRIAHIEDTNVREIDCFSFGIRDSQIISASDENIRIWNINEIEEGKIVNMHNDRISCLAVSPDGNDIATGSKYTGTFGNQEVEAMELGLIDFDTSIRIWNRTTGKERLSLTIPNIYPENVYSVGFSSDGKRIASSSPIRIWDTETGGLVQEISIPNSFTGIRYVSFGRDDSTIIAHDIRTIYVLDSQKGTELLRIKIPDLLFSSVGVSPVEDIIASSSSDNIIRIWDSKSGKMIRSIGKTGNVLSIDFSSDGKELVTASDDTTIRIWDIKTGEEIRRIEGNFIKCNSVSFSHNGQKIVSSHEDNTIRIWDVSTGREIRNLKDSSLLVSTAVFSSDDSLIYSASERILKIWGALDLNELIIEIRERFKDRQLTLEERKKYYLD